MERQVYSKTRLFLEQFFLPIKKSTVALFNDSEKNILLSGDIESNPGPVTNDSTLSQATTNGRSDFLFNYRLLRHGLKQLDVGGGGDCFFKSVSHQLYNNNNKNIFMQDDHFSYKNCYQHGSMVSHMVIHITTLKLDLQVFST